MTSLASKSFRLCSCTSLALVMVGLTGCPQGSTTNDTVADGGADGSSDGSGSGDAADAGRDSGGPVDGGGDVQPRDAAVDGVSASDAGATCSIQTPFGPLEPIAELNTAGDNTGVWLMPNQLDGYTQSTRVDGGAWEIFSTSRTSLGAPFSAPVEVSALTQANAFDGSPSPRGDGLYILFPRGRALFDGAVPLQQPDLVGISRIHVG